MATSGSVSTTAWQGNYGNRYVELKWERTAFSVVEQTTTIKWTLTGKGTYSGYVLSAPFSVVIDGDTVYQYSGERVKLYAEQEIASGTKTIKHNTDGTKTIAISVKAAIYWSEYNVSGSGSFALDLVGMASITKAPNFNDEENPTIEYYNPVGNAITSLRAAISLTGAAADIEYRDVNINGNSYTFNLTATERAILRAATQGSNSRKVRFYLRNVVEGEIYFSWKEVNYTVINANPVIAASVVDANTNTIALTGDKNVLVKYHSTAVANYTATAQKEATIEEKYIEHSGIKTATVETKTFTNIESNVFNFVATDSRNNKTTKTIQPQLVNYIKPTSNIDNTNRMDTEGNYTISCAGNYFNSKFGTASAAAANTLTVKYRYKAQGGTYTAWQTMAHTVSGNTYTATASVSGLNYRETYIFQCCVIDKLNNINSAELSVNSLPVFHWSESDFVFEVPVYFNAGSDGATSGEWTPTLTTAAAVSSYTTRQGWYQKIGNVITVGWQIKADIKAGYNTTNVVISGLPFTPAYTAFGGGIAHNVYLIAGFCFEGWAANTNGQITMRAQPCNNTAAANLQISSTAYYPTGTSTTAITLAGTICYTI